MSGSQFKKAIPQEQALISALLVNYDPAVRPVFNISTHVTVNFGMAYIQICDMDEKNQVLTSNVWLEFVSISI